MTPITDTSAVGPMTAFGVSEPAPAQQTAAPTTADAPATVGSDSLQSLSPPGGFHPIADQLEASRFNFFQQAAADAKRADQESKAKLMDMARK